MILVESGRVVENAKEAGEYQRGFQQGLQRWKGVLAVTLRGSISTSWLHRIFAGFLLCHRPRRTSSRCCF